MIISAVKITDNEKKNELILFAQEIGCYAIFSEIYGGLSIKCNNKKQEKAIKKKIKELKK